MEHINIACCIFIKIKYYFSILRYELCFQSLDGTLVTRTTAQHISRATTLHYIP